MSSTSPGATAVLPVLSLGKRKEPVNDGKIFTHIDWDSDAHNAAGVPGMESETGTNDEEDKTTTATRATAVTNAVTEGVASVATPLDNRPAQLAYKVKSEKQRREERIRQLKEEARSALLSAEDGDVSIYGGEELAVVLRGNSELRFASEHRRLCFRDSPSDGQDHMDGMTCISVDAKTGSNSTVVRELLSAKTNHIWNEAGQVFVLLGDILPVSTGNEFFLCDLVIFKQTIRIHRKVCSLARRNWAPRR